MKKNPDKYLACSFPLLTSIFLLLSSCTGEGGTEAGNPPATSRAVEGNLSSSGNDCVVDEVIATNSAGETTSATIDSSCGFSLSLTLGKSYVISFLQDDQFVATLIVNNSSGGPESSIVFVGAGATPIQLGSITLDEGKGYPERQPAEQSDRDEDGSNDYDDEDDDNDDENDDEEEDCDSDGHWDDDDEDDEDCDEEDNDDEENEEDEDNSGEGGGNGDDDDDD